MNVFTEFKKLIPQYPSVILTVVSENSDGTTTCQTLGGQVVTVQGVNGRAAGKNVIVQNGKIVSDAPTLTRSTIYI